MSPQLQFDSISLPDSGRTLREEVRAFLAEELKPDAHGDDGSAWGSFSPEFSRKLGERGWIGMTWPKAYGGGDRSALDRYVVSEELIAVRAPVSAHWVADRQSGPLLLRYGTEEQRPSRAYR